MPLENSRSNGCPKLSHIVAELRILLGRGEKMEKNTTLTLETEKHNLLYTHLKLIAFLLPEQ